MASIVASFDYAAQRWPGRAAFVQDERTIGYAEAEDFTHRCALALRANGIARGMKVAVLSPNDAVAFCCILGILRSGAVWQSVNARNAIVDMIAQFQDFDTEYLLYHSSFEAEVPGILAACPGIRGTVCIDRAGGNGPALAQWLEGHSGRFPSVHAAADEFCMIFGTGGTTGRSKGVMLSHRNIATMAVNYALAMPYETAPIHLAAAPLTHAAGFLCFWILAAGGCNVVLPQARPKAILEAIERHRVSIVFLPPTVVYMLLAEPDVRRHDYGSLRHLFYGAAPMAVDKLKEAIGVFGPVLCQGFGQTEAPCACTFLPAEDHVVDGDAREERRLRSCGRPLPFTEVALMDEAGQLLPPEQPGEIVLRGDIVMLGYYKNPEATAETFAHGWHHTGDIGVIDADGYVYIVDRKKDMIITGGFNVFPSEVEQVIWGHPAVQDCAVVGVPDEKWGEMVTAVVEAKPGMSVDADELIALCKARLGSVKAPKRVEVWPSLPRSPVGKVMKRTIRERFWQGRERAV